MKLIPYLLSALLCMTLPALAATPKVEVQVEGVTGELRTNVLEFLSLAREKAEFTAEDVPRLHERAPEEVSLALQPFGYYQPVVESDLTAQGNGWLARYRIDPGPPLKVAMLALEITGEIAGEGAESADFTRLKSDFPVKVGDTLRHLEYEKGKILLQGFAAENGYLDANFTQAQIRVDKEAYRADIVLHFDTGPRYRLGEVSFEQKELDDSFLRRFIPFKVGDVYTTSAILELQNALQNSDYFERVEVELLREQAVGQQIPVLVRLTPKPPNKYSFGVGYGTDTGVRGTVGIERRRLNSRGHRLNGEIEASQIRQRVTGRYRIPINDPRTDELAFSLGIEREDTDTSVSNRGLIGVARNVARGSWRESLSLNYQFEDFEVGSQTGQSRLLIPAGVWSRVAADDRVYTTRGSRVQLEARGAAEGVLSDTSFVQLRAQGKIIRKLGPKGRMIVRGDAGATEVSNIDDLPPSLRFFAGGDQSVRGYDFNSLGPEDENGDVIGGKYLLVGSAEYEQRLSDKWGAAVFFDAGNALNEISDPLRSGAGIGVRWRSPVGLVRVDVAKSLGDSDEGVRLHLTIGPDL